MSMPTTDEVKYILLENDIEVTWDMLTDTIRINGEAYNDKWRARLYNLMYDEGVRSELRLMRVLTEVAMNNQQHQVWDMLSTLEWDGQDHIGLLASYFKDKH